MMGFHKMFWGFIFLFDFRINGFDVIPDIIGYILIFQGLSLLMARNINFQRAKNISFPLIFLSIFNIYQINGSGSMFGFFGIIIGLAILIMDIIMVYNICMGIAEEARKIENSELETKAINRWKLYLTYNIIFMIGFIIPALLVVLFWLYIILSLVSFILILSLLKSAEYLIADSYQ